MGSGRVEVVVQKGVRTTGELSIIMPGLLLTITPGALTYQVLSTGSRQRIGLAAQRQPLSAGRMSVGVERRRDMAAVNLYRMSRVGYRNACRR
jgi:hypothetical protein